MRLVHFILVFVSLLQVACPQSYYADLSFDLDDSGNALISGRTNHPMLDLEGTDVFTSKKGTYWVFNLTLPLEDMFSDYSFEVLLPEGASVNYVKASSHFQITTRDGRISVKNNGGDEAPFVIIQYAIVDDSSKKSFDVIIYAGILLVFAIGVYLLYMKKMPEVKQSSGSPQASSDECLTDRQKDIIELLRAEKKPMNQTAICKKLGLPKSSVSRNISTLIKLRYVKKVRIGMSTMISLVEEK